MRIVMLCVILCIIVGCSVAPPVKLNTETEGRLFKNLISGLANADWEIVYSCLSQDTRCRYNPDDIKNVFLYSDVGRELRTLLVYSEPVVIMKRSDSSKEVAVIKNDKFMKSFSLVKEKGNWKIEFHINEILFMEYDKVICN